MDLQDLGKVLTAMVTPFTSDQEVDYEKARELALYLADNGSDGIVVAGSTGEAATLTSEEKIKLFSVVKDAVGTKVKVVAGTGTNNTKSSIDLSKEAEKLGVDAVMLVVPYYNKPSQQGLYEHFKAVAEAVSTPIVLYNIPSRSVVNLLPQTVSKLAEIKNVIALKESAGMMDQLSELKRLLPDDFAIYSGDDSLTLPMLALGAKGIISVAAHIVGNDIKEMVESFQNGEYKKALDIHLKLLPVFKTLFITSNPVPVKTALNQLGHQVGGVRLPLYPANTDEEAKIAEMLRNYQTN